MSELRSAIEEYRSVEWSEVPDARLEEDFSELEAAAEALEALRLRLLAEIDRRAPFARDGYLSTAGWLADLFRMSWSAARDRVRLARSLERMPLAARAFADREVTSAAVKVLAAARASHPEAYASHEEILVGAARAHGVGELRQVVAYWSQAIDHQAADEREERLRERRRLHLSPTLDGMVRIDGDLDPETGETVITALRACSDAEARSGGGELRTPAQRRADALGEVCRQWLDASGRPKVAGERPHLNVTVSLADLRDASGGTAELDHVGVVSTELARKVGCDASLVRVVLGPRSEPLDLGRRTSVVSPAIRRAVMIRDRCCRFPGCGRPKSWCDAHHIVHWADGGPTALHNLVLLCRPHHRLVHQGFRVGTDDGRATFRRPDGSPIEDRAPP